jgi:hypothetical protein
MSGRRQVISDQLEVISDRGYGTMQRASRFQWANDVRLILWMIRSTSLILQTFYNMEIQPTGRSRVKRLVVEFRPILPMLPREH